MKSFISALLATLVLCVIVPGAARAANVTYVVDPTHTYPSFEADHMGISVWRGKFDRTAGKISMDRAAGTGTVDIEVDTASIDYGLDAMNKVARSDELLDAAKYRQAIFKGKLEGFADGSPTRAVGTLELHGAKKPVTLEIRKFKCIPHPMFKREACGADAYATINREDFGMDAGKAYGFSMDVNLRIQVEAIAVE
jgi:polyisoprenoid-binding protein YceI